MPNFLSHIASMSFSLVLFLLISFARAASLDDLTWEIENDQVTITGCNQLASGTLNIPESIDGYPVFSIGDNAFSHCVYLTEVNLPNSLTSIGNYSFRQCNFQTIIFSSNLSSIGDYAFFNCHRLTNINLPDNLVNFNGSAFANCFNHRSFEISSTNEHFITVDGILYDKTIETLVAYPFAKTGSHYSLPASLRFIGDYAFSETNKLETITFSDALVNIGNSSFYGCYNLTSLSLPESITSIGDSAFRNCGGFTNLSLPGNLASLGGSVFKGCINLVNINIAPTNPHFQSLDGVLLNKSLNTLIAYPIGKTNTNFVIPEGVTTISESAFYASELVTISLPSSLATIGDYAFSSCDSLTSVSFPEGLKSIGNHGFSYCYSITSISLPEGLNSLGSSVFTNCFDIASISLPNTLVSIGSSAFSGCKELNTISIPQGTTTIGDQAFHGCDDLENIYVALSNSNYRSIDGVLFDKAMTTLISYPIGKPESAYSIPDNIASISDYAFYRCNLSEVSFPGSLITIGEYAFYRSINLIDITLPNNLSTIGNSAFLSCENLSRISFPDNLSSIEEFAFYQCTSLVRVSLLSGVSSIGNFAFYNCRSLINIHLPDSLTSISNYAFSNCESLSSIILPPNLNYIGYYSFQGCKSLSEISFPNDATFIGHGAFAQCDLLTTVIFDYTPNPYVESGIQDINPLENVLVWPRDADFFGQEGETWNGLTIQFRDTTPRITGLSFTGTTATLNVTAGPDSNYLLKYSPDLVTFSDLTTVTTGSDGAGTVNLETTEDSGYFILELVP